MIPNKSQTNVQWLGQHTCIWLGLGARHEPRNRAGKRFENRFRPGKAGIGKRASVCQRSRL